MTAQHCEYWSNCPAVLIVPLCLPMLCAFGKTLQATNPITCQLVRLATGPNICSTHVYAIYISNLKHNAHRLPLMSAAPRCAATTTTMGSDEGTLQATEEPAHAASDAWGQGEAQLQTRRRTNTPRGGSAASPCSARNINFPWVSAENVFVKMTVQRTLTSVLSNKHGKVTFTASASADSDSSFDVEVSPKCFDVGPGEYGKHQHTVTITIKARPDTPKSDYQFGKVRQEGLHGHDKHVQGVLHMLLYCSIPALVSSPVRCSCHSNQRSTAQVCCHPFRQPQGVVAHGLTLTTHMLSFCLAFLQVVWHSDKGHIVRIPLALTFTSFSAPAVISPLERKPEFTYTYKVNADPATTVAVKNSGFGAGAVTPVEVSRVEYDETGAYPEDKYPGVGRVTINVPAGEPPFFCFF